MRAFSIVVITFVVVMLSPAKADWQPQAPRFKGIESAELRNLFTEEGPFTLIKQRAGERAPMVVAGVIVNATPEKVWATLVDYKRRPEIVVGVSKVQDIKWDGNKVSIVQNNFIKFSFVKFAWKEYRTYEHFTKKRCIVMYDTPNPDKRIGGYELISMDNGKSTLLLYSVIADLRDWGFPVGSMSKRMPLIEEMLMTSAAVMIVNGIKKYSEKK